MSAQPQPPPASQPIYPRDLNLALDRVHTRFVEYANAKDEVLAAQMRIGFAEALARDEMLLKRVENIERRAENIEGGMTALANTILALADRMSKFEERMTKFEDRLTSVENTQQTMLQLIRDLHAEAMEAINDLRPKDIE